VETGTGHLRPRGTEGYNQDGIQATAAELNYPTDVALDKLGNLYIADSDNERIRMVSAQTGIITTIAGPGVYGVLGDGGPATSAYLGIPESLALDRSGNLYVAGTFTNRVRMIAANTGIISTFAGGGTSGQLGDGGLATAASLSYPAGVAVDSAGDLYISDSDDSRIRKVEAATGVITTVAGTGISGNSGDGGLALNAEIGSFQGIVLDGNGDLYFSDGYVIRRVDATTSIISTVAGDGYFAFGGDGGAATMAELNSPQGLALDAAGSLYIADELNYVVREVTFNSHVPAIIWPVPAAITYGTPLSAAQLDATSTVAGTFAYTPAAGTVLNAGIQMLSVTLTPTDTTDYDTATATVALTVNQAKPTVTVTPSAASITATQALTVTVALSGGSGNPAPSGTVILSSGTYASAATTLKSGTASIVIPLGQLAIGTDTLTATYSSNNNYSSSLGTASVKVSASTIAVLTSPAPGGTFYGSNVAFAWTAVTGATDYELFVGSTGKGSLNLYYSGNITATSATVGGLPTNGEQIYARLYTNFNGTLQFNDYNYTAVPQSQATLTSPAPGSTLPGTGVTFTWTAETGATDYELFVGSTGPGSYNLYYSGKTMATSATVGGLPTNGETVYARLYTKFGGVLEYNDYVYTAVSQAPAVLTSPVPSSALPGTGVTFTWTAATGATEYEFFVGSTGPGSYNLYYSGNTLATSASVGGLPANGEKLYARLYTKFGGVTEYSDYVYTAVPQAPAELMAPAPGTTLPAASAAFTWTAATGATDYELFIGSTGAGSYNLFYSGNTTATSLVAGGLPTNGETLYARLYTKFNGTLEYSDYTFKAVSQPPAMLNAPTQGGTLTGASAMFRWAAATGATYYELFVGSTGPGSYNLYYSGDKTVTSLTVNGLPTNGETIYARLYTNFNGTLEYFDYTFTAYTASALAPAGLNSSSRVF